MRGSRPGGRGPPLIIEEPGPGVRTRLVGGPPVVPAVNLMSTARSRPRGSGVRHPRVVGQLDTVDRTLDQLGGPLFGREARLGVRPGNVEAARGEPGALLVARAARAHPPP